MYKLLYIMWMLMLKRLITENKADLLIIFWTFRQSFLRYDIMKNWTTEHTKEIKEWFSVGNYEVFKDLTLKAYYHELTCSPLINTPRC
jgi:hypothetical protein